MQDTRDGGPWPCRAGGRHPAQRLRAGDTFETKRAAHRFSAIKMRRSSSIKMRSLNDRRQCSLPTEQTVKPLSPPPRHTCMVQAEHPSPSARQFRLLPNGLAISELRRMFCSDEGAGAAIGRTTGPSARPGALSKYGWRSAGETVACSTDAYATAVRSAISGIRRRHRWTGATV